MNTKYTIKNFRIFNEEGVSVSLKPLTLLTGCNSSGKSSLVKSLLLISDYFSALKSDNENGKRIDLTAHKLDLTKWPHSSLGKFSKVVNNKSERNSVSFGLQTHSDMLGQDVYLELVFAAGESDSTNGYIKSVTINKVDGTMIYHSDDEKKSIGNLYEILDEFIRFAYTQHFISTYESVRDNRLIGVGETMPDTEFKELEQKLKEHLDFIIYKYGKDVFLDINRWNNSHNRHSFISKAEKKPEIIEEVKDFGILYYIPFIGEKLHGSKGEVCAVLEECKLNRDTNKATASIIDKIIQDYKASTFDSFIEYYKSWEKKYLTGFKMWAHFKSSAKYPNVPDVRGAGLSADTITMSPYLVQTTAFCHFDGDDLKFDKPSEEDTTKKKEEEIARWEAMPLSFEGVFEALCILSEKYCSMDQDFFGIPTPYGSFGYSSRTERLFFSYIEEAINEIIVGAMPDPLMYISSSVINVKRLYPLESSDEFTQVLKRFIEAKRNLDEKLDYVPKTFFNKWVKAFGLGEKVTLNVDSEGLGVTLRLHKDDSDKDGTLLADNGYGITQLFALLLNIEVSIMERTAYEKDADNFIGAFSDVDKRIKVVSSPTIAVEEPEIHLHPNYQSMLADMFVEAYKLYNIHFIIETHSEYLIRKLQTYIPLQKIDEEAGLARDEISMYYLYDSDPEKRPLREPQVKSINFREDGSLASPFGKGFFDEADNLAMSLLFGK